MSAEKYALLEARIRQTANLVGQLREENQQLLHENQQLRERVAVLEEQARRRGQPGSEAGQHLDDLLAQLDTLHEPGQAHPADETVEAHESETARGAELAEEEPHEDEPHEDEPQTAEDYFQLGKTYERRGQFEPAVEIYQQLLEADGNNLEVAQRLAFLLEKLNRDEEAAPLWDRIWRMRAGRSRRQRWSR